MMKSLTDKLKSKRIKVTPQRLAIYKILTNTTEHPSAEIIYKQLLPTHPTMSLATVYKTLDTLIKAKLIQSLNVGEDSFRYDANANTHPHAICLSCHKVIDLHTKALDGLGTKVQEDTEFEVINEQVFFYGYCKDCKTKH